MSPNALSAVSYEDSWNIILNDLKEEFGEKAYNSWFSHMGLLEVIGSKVIISVPSRFIKDWISSNYLKYINRKVSASITDVRDVELKVIAKKKEDKPKCLINDNAFKAHKDCEILSSRLNPKFTFENFVTGSANKVAHRACKVIAEGEKLPGSTGLLFIHSKVGMGKTHLLQSVASYIRTNAVDKKVAFLSAERFMHLFIKSVKNNDIITFKEKLRSADVLIIDDLQMICGRTGTAQEFSNIINSFLESDKNVIISGDSSPYEMNLDSRTKSRLCGGLVVEIKPSSYNHRMRILRKLSEQHNAEMDEKILSMIAKKITSSIRELEGALNKIISHEELFGEKMSGEEAEHHIKDNIQAHDKSVTVELIIDFVSKQFGVKVSDILSKSRSKKFVIPRQVSAYLAKQLTTKSLQEIGFKLGKRDHATVVYSVKKLEAEMEKNEEIRTSVSKIIESISE